MSEFKYACPVCGQHMMCDSSQSGTTMECPTCFQKIVAPQAPATDDPKFIITGTKLGERPIPAAVANAETPPAPVVGKSFPGPAVVFVVIFLVAVAVLFLFHRKIFKSTGNRAGPGPAAMNGNTPASPPLEPIGGLAMVVLAKGDSIVLDAGTAGPEVKDPAQAGFLAAFKADVAQPAPFEGPLELSALPEAAQKTPNATGEILYHSSFPGGLVMGIKLEGLLPRHVYVLTLNGISQHAGNDNLPEQILRYGKQRFYDFSRITTDANGCYQATFGILLPPGPYDIYFFVKDTTDWKLVLSNNFFKFTVK